MRVRDRLSVIVAMAFVLAGLGAPACPETHQPGGAVTAAHRSIVHVAPLVTDQAATPHCPVPRSRDPRVVEVSSAYLSSGPPVEAVGGSCGDHRARTSQTDGPDDPLPGVALRIEDAAVTVLSANHYRPPALPLPPRGTVPARAPPTTA